MSYFYPQASVILGILFEDFKGTLPAADLQQIYALPIVARDVVVNINDYTTADTFELEIDYKNFPFDPRCIRSCRVTIHIEDIKTIFQNGNALKPIIPSAENVVFQGFADDDSITFDDEHRSVKLSGRDFTGLLTDTKAPTIPLSTDLPLDVLIQGIFDKNPSLKNLKIDNRTGNAKLPVINDFAPDNKLQNTVRNPRPNENLWDVIQNLILSCALVAFIEIDKLVITKPRILYSNQKKKQFIYGQNIQSLEFKRKLGRKKGFNIVCISLVGKEIERAEIPKDSTKEWSDSIGVTQEVVTIPQMDSEGNALPAKPAPPITFRFNNMKKEQLIQNGQAIFEEMSRQQLEGTLMTKEMVIAEAAEKQDQHTCFSALLMRVGTPIEVHINQGDMKGLAQISTVAEREKFLIKRCYDPKVAHAFAQTLGSFHPKFFTKAVQFKLNQDTGFQMKIDFINFIELDNKKLGLA